MSKWVNRLDFIDLWKKRDEEKITIVKLGKEVAKRIRKLKCYEEEYDTLEGIAVDFENLGEDVDDFDSILSNLYDWGDIPLDNNFGGEKMCWIATSF